MKDKSQFASHKDLKKVILASAARTKIQIGGGAGWRVCVWASEMAQWVRILAYKAHSLSATTRTGANSYKLPSDLHTHAVASECMYMQTDSK